MDPVTEVLIIVTDFCGVGWLALAQQHGNRNAALLLAFSLGRISDLEVMEQLNLVHEEDLFLRMAQAHLPMPHLPDQATEAMVGNLQQLI